MIALGAGALEGRSKRSWVDRMTNVGLPNTPGEGVRWLAVPSAAMNGEVRAFPEDSRASSEGSVMEGIPVVTVVRLPK
jgi:hypothetical protein